MNEIERALAAIAAGGMVVVADDEAREDEGDLIMAAQHATPEAVAFFLAHTSGLLCVGLPPERVAQLELPQMVAANGEVHGTAFTVSVDHREAGTGISAAARALTVRELADPASHPGTFVRPGHVFPLRATPGGVLKRAGHTEAAVDLARLAGVHPAGLLCELTTADKTGMARRPELRAFADRHDLPYLTIAELVRYRVGRERLVTRGGTSVLPTRHGVFTATAWRSTLDAAEHLALTLGDVSSEDSPVLTRVHSECLTGDALGSLRCDCGGQLDRALAMIAAEGRGVVVYLRGHEGRGIGLAHKLRAYELQDAGRDTVDANLELGLPVDDREYGVGAQILLELGVRRLRLLTNNPAKYTGLAGYGLEIVERLRLTTEPNPHSHAYLRAKQRRLGHDLGLDVLEVTA